MLDNRFFISKYRQTLLHKPFADKHVTTDMIGGTIEQLCFLLVHAEGLSMGQVHSLVCCNRVVSRDITE
jgi:hypothetical protein